MDRPSSPQLLEVALHYAIKLNWAVLPLHSVDRSGRYCTCGNPRCESVAKHPRTRHGVKDASKDEKVIRDWWRRWPLANVGIATGEVSRIFVVDIDPRHGGDKSLQEWEDQGQHLLGTTTMLVLTGGGGQHFYFRYPKDGTAVGNKVNLAPGIDVRGTGGYVVAPPSIHASGRGYEWSPV